MLLLSNYKLSGKYLKILKYINKCDTKGIDISLTELCNKFNYRKDYIVTITTDLLKEKLIKMSNNGYFFSTPKSITLLLIKRNNFIEKIFFSFIIPIVVAIITSFITTELTIWLSQ